MRYSGLNLNDLAAAPGLCVTLFMQGCPHHCPGCHNPESWDFEGGTEIKDNVLIDMVLKAICANGITRNLSISGGEPLCAQNLDFTKLLIQTIKQEYKNIKIYLWTGYELHQLQQNPQYDFIFDNVDIIIAGPFILEQRDITLPLCGSRNQQIWRKN